MWLQQCHIPRVSAKCYVDCKMTYSRSSHHRLVATANVVGSQATFSRCDTQGSANILKVSHLEICTGELMCVEGPKTNRRCS